MGPWPAAQHCFPFSAINTEKGKGEENAATFREEKTKNRMQSVAFLALASSAHGEGKKKEKSIMISHS